MKYPILFLFILLSFLSCRPVSPDFGIAENYLPSAEKLGNGVVNKYYIHFNSKDNYEANTNVEYVEYRLLSPEKLAVNNYNAAMEPTRKKVFRFENNLMLLESEERFFQSDTVASEIVSSIYCDWTAPGIEHEKTMTYKTWHRRLTNKVKNLRDTIALNRPAKLIIRNIESNFIRLPKGDSTNTKHDSRELFVQDIGSFSNILQSEKGTTRIELIEQMEFSEFQERAKHGIKRVAYINTEKTLDKKTGFKLCDTESKIVDYYNGDPDAGFIGGKRALRKAIQPVLDSEKLHNESGYLTFRFVINCDGKIGRFTTEQADLDFKRKEFHSETVEHLYQILLGFNSWQATVIRKEKRDAYAYITFKLKEGKLIELLP